MICKYLVRISCSIGLGLIVQFNFLRGLSFSMYAKLSEKLTFLCAYQGNRNASFSENFVYVVNERFTMGSFNPLSAKFIKWSNTLKQIVGKLPTICLSVFDHFSGLALKGLKLNQTMGGVQILIIRDILV